MKWEGNRQSDNVEDRRSGSDGSSGGGGGLLGALLGGRRLSVGAIVIALLGGWALGINPLTILGLLDGGGMQPSQVQQAPAKRPPVDDRMAAFVSTVLADTEDGLDRLVHPGWQRVSGAASGAVSWLHHNRLRAG